MDYRVHGILQARILEWVAFPFTRGSSQPRDQTRSPTLQTDSLSAEPQEKPKNTEVGGLSLLQWIFLTQESNHGLLNSSRGNSHFTSGSQPAVCVRLTLCISWGSSVLETKPLLCLDCQRERKVKISYRGSRIHMDSSVSISMWISLQPYRVSFEQPPHQVLWKAEAASFGYQSSSSYKVSAISFQTPLEANTWVSWLHFPIKLEDLGNLTSFSS